MLECFHLVSMLLFIHTCSSESHSFCPICHPHLGTYTSTKEEKPGTPGPVNNMMVVQRGTWDIIIFALDILQVLSFSSSGLFYFLVFSDSIIYPIYGLCIAHHTPSNRCFTCLKYKDSYWEEIFKSQMIEVGFPWPQLKGYVNVSWWDIIRS